MKHKTLLLISLLLVSCLHLYAQVKIKYNNTQKIDSKGYFKKEYKLKAMRLAVPPLENMRRMDQENTVSLDKPFRIAEALPSDIDVTRSAAWTNEGDYSYGIFQIHADSAKTLSVFFDRFYLPEGLEMFMYNSDGSMIAGPISNAINNKQQRWHSAILKGEDIYIEIKLPATAKSALKLHISNVAYGFKPILGDETGGFGLSLPCQINVMCPLGNGWELERNSVALVIDIFGTTLCSGALLANTSHSRTPYFLTANHFLESAPDPTTWGFQFQAWSPTCTPGTNNEGVLYFGASLLAAYAPSDFALVLLDQTPPCNSGLAYAGWDRSGLTPYSTVGIHHPKADVMKIAADNNAPVRTGYGVSGNDHWQVGWDNGLTEEGSSGSPLFNPAHRVIGQLHGGIHPYTCTNSTTHFYGAFDVSWTGGGTNTTRLSNWLDAANTGAQTTDTYISPSSTYALSISGPGNLCGTASYSVPALPAGGTVTWSASGNISISGSATANPVTVVKTAAGSGVLTAVVNSDCFNGSTTFNITNTALTFPSYVLAPATLCANESATIQFTSGNVLSATGNVDGVQIPLFSYSSTSYEIPGNVYQVTVTMSAGCGIGTASHLFRKADCGFFSVFPNPAGNELNVQYAADAEVVSAKAKITSPKELILYNKKGVIVYSGVMTENKTTINTTRLPSGNYYLKMKDGEQTTTRQVVIHH